MGSVKQTFHTPIPRKGDSNSRSSMLCTFLYIEASQVLEKAGLPRSGVERAKLWKKLQARSTWPVCKE